jgi:hypothetical protein
MGLFPHYVDVNKTEKLIIYWQHKADNAKKNGRHLKARAIQNRVERYKKEIEEYNGT